MLKLSCPVAAAVVFVLSVSLFDLQQNRLLSTEESVLGTTWGGDCEDCFYDVTTCQQTVCQPYEIAGWSYMVLGTLAVEATCYEVEAGESGDEECSTWDDHDCNIYFVCADEGCTNCTSTPSPQVKISCSGNAVHCVGDE